MKPTGAKRRAYAKAPPRAAGAAPRSLVRDPAAVELARELAAGGCGRDRLAEALGCGYSTAGRLLRAAGAAASPRAGRRRAPRVPPFTGGDPGAPTDAPPGSPAKMSVLQARAAQGLPLFHPGDREGGQS